MLVVVVVLGLLLWLLLCSGSASHVGMLGGDLLRLTVFE